MMNIKDMQEKIDNDVKKEIDDFFNFLHSEKSNEELNFIRILLEIESLIDQTLELVLPNSKVILDNKNLYLIDKTTILESLNILTHEDKILILNLNSLRNKCAHRRNYQISISDIKSLFSSMRFQTNPIFSKEVLPSINKKEYKSAYILIFAEFLKMFLREKYKIIAIKSI